MSDTERSEKRTHMNVVDFLLLAAIVAILLCLAARYKLSGRILGQLRQQTAEVVFLVEDVRDSSYDALQIGDVFYIEGSDRTLGTLKTKNVGNYLTYIERADGTLAQVSNEQRSSITGTLEIKGLKTDEGFFLGGTQHISAGSTLTVYTSQLQVTMTVLSLKTDES